MTHPKMINPDYVPEPEKMNVKKGLEGAVIDQTSVSKVTPETNSLIYRGYPVDQLAQKCSFEQVAYLLWNNELPTQEELKQFENKERGYRTVSSEVAELIRLMPKTAHPMDVIRTAVSALGCQDPRIWDKNSNPDKALQLLAKIPTCVAIDIRRRKGQAPISPRTDLSIAENFFWMCFEALPQPEIVKAFDASLTLYAEHSFNASTFAARVITSTESDIYSATVGGIGALKGPLHGGANEAVMHMMLEISDPAQAEAWMKNALAQKKKVMGFGHRVYKYGDSRVPTMKKYLQIMSQIKNETRWITMYEALETVMVETKGIYPNLDFPAGPAYYLMGFEIEFFTPIFVMARTTGWSAHIIEQTSNNRIIRPLSEYTGTAERSL